MSCNCPQPGRAADWTVIPAVNQPTERLRGENIDCYMARADDGGIPKDILAQKEENKIDNMSITADLELNVNETFRMTKASTIVASTWEILFDGVSGVPASFGGFLTFNPTTGVLSGTVPAEAADKNYEVEIKAFDALNVLIDSKKYNFFPKKVDPNEKGDLIKFVFPYRAPPGGPAGRVTSPFSDSRVHPTLGVKRPHNGIDISSSAGPKGDILAAADGEVIVAGPARGFGNWIQIAHKDARGTVLAVTVYAHMESNEIFVRVGQKVAAGQVIAKEGRAGGISTGDHLHFELHLGGWKKPVDPVPYLTGQFDVARDVTEPGKPDPSTVSSVNNSNVGLTSKEVSARARCPDLTTNTDYASPTPVDPTPQTPEPTNVVPVPGREETYAQIVQALNEDPSLTDIDKRHLLFVAKIESRYIADAKNPSSSARGVFQMLDKIANVYYGQIGVAPTIENRNNPYLATKAQIQFYKNEQKPYWDGYIASGKTSIANKTLTPEVKAKYDAMQLTQGEFTYGLIHHDGVGNAVRGIDKQGVDYYRKKIRSA